MRKIILSILMSSLFLILPSASCSLEGFDYDTGDYIEIDDEDVLRPGNQIAIYDYADQTYHEVEIASLSLSKITEMEVYDYDADQYRTFELPDLSPIKG